MPNDFVVKARDFEGPLELLLELIEEHKLSVNEVSLSTISDEYIRYIETIGVRDRESLSQFISIAATLMLIKSRTLLPSLALTEEEEGNIDELEQRLRAYAEVKEASKKIENLFLVSPLFHTRHTSVIIPIFTPDKQVTEELLRECITKLLHELPKQELHPEAKVKRTLDIKDVIESLVERVRGHIKIPFSSLISDKEVSERKSLIVVHFLALLELMKYGTISVGQSEEFGEIMIESQNI